MTNVLTLTTAGSDSVVAMLCVDTQGYLSPQSETSPEIANLISNVNSQQSLRVNAPAPMGAKLYEVFGLDVDRGDAEIAEIVAQFIQERFGYEAKLSDAQID